MRTNYEEMAARAERGELRVIPGTVRRGEDAAGEARRALMAAAGVSTVEDLTRMTVGRPSVGASEGVSPVVRARVSEHLKSLVAAVAQEQHRRESDIVRDALAAYVTAHAGNTSASN